MERKLDDYFKAGVVAVWMIDGTSQSATVHEARDRRRELSLTDALTAEGVLPGFRLPLQELFVKAGNRSRRK